MDPNHFIIMLLFGYLTNTILIEAQAYSTISPQSITFKSSMSDTSANFGNGTETLLGQPLHLINTPSGQPTPLPVSGSSGQAPASPVPGSSRQLLATTVPNFSEQSPLPTIPRSSGETPEPPIHKSSSQPIAFVPNSTRQSPSSPASIFSMQPTASPISNSLSESPGSPIPASSGQPPASFVTNSTSQPPGPLVPSSSRKPQASSVPTTTRQSASAVVTPGFNQEENNTPPQMKPQSSSANSIAAVLIGTILTLMIVAICIIVLWKCFRKPILKDQNWAGRSPFADGETPDLCVDYSKENGLSIKRPSIVSLEIWKPNKSMLLADDLDVKLFESSENVDECPTSDMGKMNDHPNGTSEESADRSTVGTAISSSEEMDLTPAPPLLDLEGQEKQTHDLSNLSPNDFSHLPPPLDCLHPEGRQSSPPLSDSSILPPPPEELLKDQGEDNSELHNSLSSTSEMQFPVPPDSNQQALDESLPPPPVELL